MTKSLLRAEAVFLDRNTTLATALAGLMLVRCVVAAADDGKGVWDTQSNTGFYLGGALGRSSQSVDIGSLEQLPEPTLSGSATGYQLAAGYRPIPALAGELDYVDFGRVSSGANELSTDGIVLSALGYLPTPLINLYGRAGLAESKSYGRCECVADSSVLDQLHRHGVTFVYGVGASTNFKGYLNLRLEFEAFDLNYAGRMDLSSLGVTWSF